MKKWILCLAAFSSMMSLQSSYAHDKEPPCNHESLDEARGADKDPQGHDHEHEHHHGHDE